MSAVSYTYLRQNLKEVFDLISDTHEAMIVTRKNGCNMVVVSEADYNAMEETGYLMHSSANLERLKSSLGHSLEGDVRPFSFD